METASIIRRIQRTAKPLARCKRSATQPIKKRTAGADRNGFLSHHFTPFWGIERMDWKRTQKEFFQSLSHLCALYGMKEPEVTGLSFPQNIVTTYKAIRTAFVGREWDCIIARDRTRMATLATVRVYDTGHTLYYIPVRPLWKLMQDREARPLAKLIVCLFGYLYKVVGVPYYRGGSYMGNTYEAIQNWIADDTEDGEDEYRQEQQLEMDTLQAVGDKILPMINRPFDVEKLKTLLVAYQNCSRYDTEIEAVVTDFLKLWEDFPHRSIKESMIEGIRLEDDGDRIYLEQYLSFFWSSNDCIYNNLEEMVNSELQEMGYQEEPIAVQWFDTPQEKEQHCFDFEKRLFDAIDQLTEQLNRYDDEKCK